MGWTIDGCASKKLRFAHDLGKISRNFWCQSFFFNFICYIILKVSIKIKVSILELYSVTHSNHVRSRQNVRPSQPGQLRHLRGLRFLQVPCGRRARQVRRAAENRRRPRSGQGILPLLEWKSY